MINIQYLPCGHVSQSDDPKLIATSEERARKGFLDALILPSSDCDECNEWSRMQTAKYGDYGLSLEDA